MVLSVPEKASGKVGDRPGLYSWVVGGSRVRRRLRYDFVVEREWGRRGCMFGSGNKTDRPNERRRVVQHERKAATRNRAENQGRAGGGVQRH